MKRWASLLSVLVLMVAQSPWWADVRAQPSSEHHQVSVASDTTNDPHGEHADGGWEGSAQGVAYSEFNHRFAGLFVLLFGLAELGHALRSGWLSARDVVTATATISARRSGTGVAQGFARGTQRELPNRCLKECRPRPTRFTERKV